jgi:hypothetical protein
MKPANASSAELTNTAGLSAMRSADFRDEVRIGA